MWGVVSIYPESHTFFSLIESVYWLVINLAMEQIQT